MQTLIQRLEKVPVMGMARPAIWTNVPLWQE